MAPRKDDTQTREAFHIFLRKEKRKSHWISSNDPYLMEEIIHKMVLLHDDSGVPIVIFPTLQQKGGIQT